MSEQVSMLTGERLLNGKTNIMPLLLLEDARHASVAKRADEYRRGFSAGFNAAPFSVTPTDSNFNPVGAERFFRTQTGAVERIYHHDWMMPRTSHDHTKPKKLSTVTREIYGSSQWNNGVRGVTVRAVNPATNRLRTERFIMRQSRGITGEDVYQPPTR